jgi:hypothetical protein
MVLNFMDYILIIGGLIIAGIVFLVVASRLRKRKAKAMAILKGDTKEELKEVKDPNTLVLDQRKGRVKEYIEHPAGRLWRYGGDLFYLMKRRYANGVAMELEVVEPPKQLDVLPEKLWRALHDNTTGIWIVPEESLLQRLGTIGIWIMVILAIVLVIVWGKK